MASGGYPIAVNKYIISNSLNTHRKLSNILSHASEFIENLQRAVGRIHSNIVYIANIFQILEITGIQYKGTPAIYRL
jgi:hypothetical protein